MAENECSVVGIDKESYEFFKSSKEFYELLSSIYYLELTEDQLNGLTERGFEYPEDGSPMAQACKKMRLYLERRGINARQDLAVDYARVFLSAGVYEGKSAVPFESVYTSQEGILMQDSRDDVVKIYAENGLSIPSDLNVPEDHLSFELEFMARICNRIATSLEAGEPTDNLMRTQLAFIEEHLLNWIWQLQERVGKTAKLAFYPAIMEITISYLEEHKRVLEEALEECLQRR